MEHAGNLAAPPAMFAELGSTKSNLPTIAAGPALSAALDRLFAERPGTPIKRVKAVIITKQGRIIGERYAPGFSADSAMLSWSVAKSFTNAFLGILVRQGRMAIDRPLAASEWHGPSDGRSAITIEDLLRMRSGLDAPETGSATDAVTRMLYTQADMAGYAARRRLKRDPGKEWEYTSANTLLIDRAIGNTVAGGAAGMRAFAQKELFEPLDMHGVTMEFDGVGTFIGSSYVYATARTFAKFGELYLNDGVASNGQRVLPKDWVAWSSRSTLGLAYGAGFWTNDGNGEIATARVKAGFPQDGFFASGNQGQRIYIVPSAHLVIARFGYSEPPRFGIEDDLALIAAATKN